MKILGLAIAVASFLISPANGAAHEPAQLFQTALSKVKVETKVPILLPSELPSPMKESDIHFVDGHGESGKYEFSLYYEKGAGDAGFAGYFAGDAQGVVSFKEKIPLEDGIIGFFRAKSCGGSCSPTSIEWVQGGILYTAQLRLNLKSNLEQRRALVSVANSAIRSGAR